MAVCFCTLAIRDPYRRRARLLCQSAPGVPWVVLTDDPDAFADLPVRALFHTPTGPMAEEYLARRIATGDGRGAAAYHDKRFAIQAALEEAETALYLDADSQIGQLPPIGTFPAGISVLPVVHRSIAAHLEIAGTWRTPIFVEAARQLTGSTTILETGRWCHEALMAVTRDGREAQFFATWSYLAAFFQGHNVFSGEGGVIGMAAAHAGWSVDYGALTTLGAAIAHESGGPKQA